MLLFPSASTVFKAGPPVPYSLCSSWQVRLCSSCWEEEEENEEEEDIIIFLLLLLLICALPRSFNNKLTTALLSPLK